VFAGTVKVRYLLTLFIMTLFISPVYAFDCLWTAPTGLQLNGSSIGMMLDALPGLGGTN